MDSDSDATVGGGQAVVLGGAGFLGSHLVDRLMAAGVHCLVLDNECTGRFSNLARWQGRDDCRMVSWDVSTPFPADAFGLDRVDYVFQFASPASPPHYRRLALETLAVNAQGTWHALELAQRFGARLILASTSEVYGDPLVSPQPESYWGNVNSVGPRACYDESKRYAEALTMEWHRRHDLDVRILRFFNCYGPRMQPDDGRVVSNFITQALRGEPLTVYGSGLQTRSFCYVSDEVEAIWRAASYPSLAGQVLNIGNPEEHTIREFAEIVSHVAGVPLNTVDAPLPPDDPTNRRPDIARARTLLRWEPVVSLEEGLTRTMEYFQEV